MDRSNRLKIIFIMLFFFAAFALGQDNQEKEVQQLREEILAAYQSGGEQGLLDFVKKQKDKISNKFIVDFAEAGKKEEKEEWLKVCEVMALEKKDRKTLADVWYNKGRYFMLVPDNKKAAYYFEKAFLIYLELNDPMGKGNVYMGKGIIYSDTGENTRAMEMYRKALLFFEKSKSLQGQGNVHLMMGFVYFNTGDSSNAIEMFDKASLFFEKTGDHDGQGVVHFTKGTLYFQTNDYHRALKMYEKALFFFEKAGEPYLQGNVYLNMGIIYATTGNNSKALGIYDKALHFFKKTGDLIGQGDVYQKTGDIYSAVGENPKALEMNEKALTFYEKAGYPIGQGNAYLAKGIIYSKYGENLKAVELYDKALSFYERIDYPSGQGDVYKNKGNIYSAIGDSSKAFEMYDKALPFYKKAGDLIGLGNVYLNKGNIYSTIGNNSRAIEMYDKALPFFKKSREPRGQGNVYLRRGYIFFNTGDNFKALEMYEKALPFYEKAQDVVGQGNVYLIKGNIYSGTGDNTRALKMFENALSFFKKAGNPIGQGNVYHILGNIYSQTGDNLNAHEMYDQALHFYKKSENTIGLGNVYHSKGDIYSQTGDNIKAHEMYDKAMYFSEKAGQFTGQGNVYHSKGAIYLNKGNNLKAIEMYDKALPFLEKAGAIYVESFVIHGKAKALANLGKKIQALDFFEKGIDKLEKVRTQTAFPGMKNTFMEMVYKRYEETVLFTLENKYREKGFRYAESMRARVFLDRMAEELVRLDKGLNPELKKKRDNLVAKLSSISKQIHEAAGGKNEKKLQKLKEQYRNTEDEFDELLIKIRLENPLYASIRYPRPISVQELQKKVLKKGEILVCYFISPGKLYVFLISKKKFKVVPLEFKEKRLNWAVKKYQLALIEYNSSLTWRYGKILYRKLFKPLEPEIERSKNVIIIPDGQLATIPFECFIIDKKESGQPLFLLEKYRLKYIQSASILSLLRKHYRINRETNSFIGFGDPVYDYENFKLGKPEKGDDNPVKGDEIKEIHRGKYVREGGEFVRLNGSGQEVNTIAEFFKKQGSEKCVVHIREKATEENAKASHLKEFDYLHFSCHGILGDTFQSLVLSQDIPGAKDDGYFTLNEIMNCDYNAKLVVLSACQTASGKLERAEGVTGMTRAVMYAGTPAVVATLWKVDDEATKELMIHFYRNMLEKNLDKAEALRQAKLTLIKNKKYHSPLFWSAFVMYGE